ncbi:MAG: 23S rRNA (adenine(2503)-C(2))-methyltransferase RlmN [Oscillospiraceae bacterium]|uniref:Probable dual-specificity RNA methyltransferase RlmN n=1 Tax=Caproicibacterium lactatifermentans TaxID=2666138 RepID=A0A859DR73_9FIRM|nr:23S rRNA (adenine(2503)-C(2))-methyltransferase RlmN [Caproicibacterium lactatifermentans]MDD4807903.1 23S rRNA (adenine(2503)-C(2))-methyltransferase RlmN [Oscillospiraceae bacterium]QKN23999.1 23S rRNA (adenine(2503)-C(2))-methyltransferase RlmN [Caproicibacterium lactatifermentans]QKO30930.1 23S rRNA (adenine(2503)-C(2))-methyltransferase RlmN [Caproicibacterium lactatifermentans]
MEPEDIRSKNQQELSRVLSDLGQPSYRAKQVFSWLQKNGIQKFSEMTNVSKALREALAQRYYIANAEIAQRLVSKIDGTRKYLFQLNDGELVEAVLMDYHHGRTICISTQVGCRMNCTFCATGKSGFSRNMTAGEMVAEVQAAQRDGGVRISNIVLMGMGEPLDNYENVLRFLELITNIDGMNIGMRHISLSTCGLVDRIYDLAEHRYQLTLSVSLHAPNDQIRSQTMPISRKYSIEELLKACRYYEKVTGRRVSYEYAMISGINDSEACAKELAERLEGTLCHVNLIPVNSVAGTGYRKSPLEKQQHFISILEHHGITATVRRTLGSDINASCGQLRRRRQEEVSHV